MFYYIIEYRENVRSLILLEFCYQGKQWNNLCHMTSWTAWLLTGTLLTEEAVVLVISQNWRTELLHHFNWRQKQWLKLFLTLPNRSVSNPTGILWARYNTHNLKNYWRYFEEGRNNDSYIWVNWLVSLSKHLINAMVRMLLQNSQIFSWPRYGVRNLAAFGPCPEKSEFSSPLYTLCHFRRDPKPAPLKLASYVCLHSRNNWRIFKKLIFGSLPNISDTYGVPLTSHESNGLHEDLLVSPA
jgi:hypothetical protein